MPDDTPVTPDPNAASQTVSLDAKQLAEMVNSAITNHMKRFETKQTETFQKLIADAVKSAAPVPDPEEASGKPSKGKADPQLAAMQARLDELTKNASAAEDRARNAEAKQRQDRAQNDVRASLAGKVRPEVVDSVAKLLFADGRVELDDNGTPFVKVRRPNVLLGNQEEDVLMPLADGIASYLKEPHATGFLPAPGGNSLTAPTRGGSRFPQQVPPGTAPKYDTEAKTDEEKVRRAYEAEQAHKARLGMR